MNPQFEADFLAAWASQDLQSLLWQIDFGRVDVDHPCGASKDTALMLAASLGEAPAVKALLAHGADVSWSNLCGYTPLMKAASKGHEEVIRLMILRDEAALFAKDEKGRTALDWARLSHQEQCARLLEAAVGRFFVRQQEVSRCGIRQEKHLAVLRENERLAEEVVNAVSSNDCEALHEILARTDKLAKSEFLAAREALRSSKCPEVNTEIVARKDNLAKHGQQRRNAGDLGNKAAQKEVLARKVKVAKHDSSSGTAASDSGENMAGRHAGLAKMDMSGQFSEQSASKHSCFSNNNLESLNAAKPGKFSLAKAALTGIDDFYLDHDWKGMTPLVRASMADDGRLVSSLIANGADMDRVTSFHHNALSAACACGCVQAVMALLSHNPDIHLRTTQHQRTPLLHACLNHHPEVVALLLDYAFHDAMSRWKTLLASANISLQDDPGRIREMKDWSDLLHATLTAQDAAGRSALEAMQEDAKIHTMFTEVFSRIESRRHRLEADANLERFEACSFGCGFSDRFDKIPDHERRHCPLRKVACELGCGELVGVGVMQEHIETCCPERLVTCCNLYKGCRAKVKAKEKQLHETERCRKRMERCRLGCGQAVPADELLSHETEACRLRVMQCPSCKIHLQCAAMKQHTKHECPQRLVRCSVGCGEKFPAEKITEHEENDCVQPCALGCGQKIGPRDKREIHERFLCRLRRQRCENGCGMQLTAEELQRHLDACGHARVDCPNECGRVLMRKELEAHVAGEIGTCPLRALPCWMDYVGRRVTTVCGQVATVVRFDIRTETHFVRFAKGTELEPVQLGNDQRKFSLLDSADLTCGLLPAKNRRAHVEKSCPRRLVQCSLGCGQRMQAQYLAKHEQTTCEFRIVSCACGEEVEAKALRQHKVSACRLRMVDCVCGEQVADEALSNHAETSCAKTLLRCPLGCGVYVERVQLEHHCDSQCAKRQVSCSLGCGAVLWAEEATAHNENICPQRSITCACDEAVKALDMAKHREEACDLRLVHCEQCGQDVAAKRLAVHRSEDCSGRPRRCPSGCGEDVPENLMEEHEKSLCARRLVACPLGCGQWPRLDHLQQHQASQCIHREVECQRGCGKIVVAERLPDHEVSCWLRTVRCGAAAKACERPLARWVLGDRENGKGRLVRCEAHGETALSFACRSGDLLLLRHLMTLVAGDGGEEAAELIRAESLSGHSALTRAAAKGQLEVVRSLILYGAEVNHETSRGKTALHEAVLAGAYEVAQLLLEHRAVIRPNRLGLSPLSVSQRLGNTDMTAMLAEAFSFHQQLHQIFHHITLEDIDALDDLLPEGRPYVPLEEQKIAASLEAIREERAELLQKVADLKQESASLRPAFQLAHDRQAMAEADEDTMLRQVALHEEEIHRHESALVLPLRTAMQEAGFLRQRDLLTLAEISQPAPPMLALARATCALLHLCDANADAWATARQSLMRDSRRTKQLLLAALKTSFSPAAAAFALTVHATADHPISQTPLAYGQHEDETLQYPLLAALDAFTRAAVAKAAAAAATEPLAQRQRTLRAALSTHADVLRATRRDRVVAERRWRDADEPLREIHERLSALEREERSLEEQRRCCRLLSASADGGHSALSWAATIGSADIVQLLLDRGAPVDFPDAVLHAAAAVAQLAWRASRTRGVRRLGAMLLIDMKRKAYRLARSAARAPLAQALYNGHVEAARVLVRSGARLHLHAHVAPCGAPPFARAGDVRGPFGAARCAALGAWAQGSCTYAYGKGWTGEDKHREAVAFAEHVSDVAEGRRMEAVERVRARRAVAAEAARQRGLNAALAEAVTRNAFERVQDLLDEGASADAGFPSGHTTLSYAAAVGARVASKDGSGTALLVTMLLERQTNAPNVNAVNGLGRSALAEAALAGRLDVMQALVERGAQPNQVLPGRKTALLLAAAAGKAAAVRMLLIRGANVLIKDDTGRTATDWARRRNFSQVLAVVAQHRGRDLGAVCFAPRGKADQPRPCRWGCGAAVGAASAAHEAECPKRVVACPLGCGESGLWAEELQAHVEQRCPSRVVACPLACKASGLLARDLQEHMAQRCERREIRCEHCGEALLFRFKRSHDLHQCKLRPVACELGCGETVHYIDYAPHKQHHCPERIVRCRHGGCVQETKAKDRELHETAHCLHRPVACQFGCEQGTTYHARAAHEQLQCPLRHVPCPNRCGAGGIAARALDEHMRDACANRFVACPQGCAVKVRAREVRSHCEEACRSRKVDCALCGERMVAREVDVHLRYSCEMQRVPCTLGCGEKVERVKMQEHKADKCAKRRMKCSRCPKMVSAEERHNHEQYECKLRKAQCRQGCKQVMLAKELGKHERGECPLRTWVCACGDHMPMRQKEEHLRSECPRRALNLQK